MTDERAEVLVEEDLPSRLEDELGTLSVTATGERPLFVGIGAPTRSSRISTASARSLVQDVDYHPSPARYERVPGDAPAAAAGIESASGSRRPAAPAPQTLQWKPRSGDWSVVVMNADAARGVTADVNVGVQRRTSCCGSRIGLPSRRSVLIAGAAAVCSTLGTRWRPAALARPPRSTAGRRDGRAAPASTPTRSTVTRGARPEPLSRWLWIVKWFLAIPHAIVLAFLWLGLLRAHRGGVLRDPHHRPLPARRCSTSTSGCCAGPGAWATTPGPRSAPTATRRSPSAIGPGLPRRPRRSPTPSGCRA